MKKTLLILMTLCITAIGYSQTFTESFITYQVTSIANNTVRISDYNPAGGPVLTITNTVIDTATGTMYSVTEITNFAFENNQLTSVTIPSNIVSIGDFAFQGNPLTCVISEAVTPSTITTSTSSGLDTFVSNGDRSNIDLTIPTGTASAYTAAQWTGFNSVAEGLTGTFIIDNITYQINATPNNEVTITDYNTAGGTGVNIPANVNSGCTEFSVVNIGDYAFNNKGLTNIIIPNSVTTIGLEVFRNNSIVNVDIPDSVTSIGDSAFADNELVSVTISNSITEIPIYAFGGNQLTNINIPDSVTSIGSSAFLGNELTNFTLSSNVTTIGLNVFMNNLLTDISIPNTVVVIGEGAFKNNQLTNVFIPNSVVSIGPVAFQNNQLASFTIPESITSIGAYAFGDNLLTSFTSLAITPPSITSNLSPNDTFGGNRGNIDLFIPTSTMGPYVTDTGAEWIGFKTVTEGILSVTNFELANNIKIITTPDAIKVISSNSVRLENYAVYSISGAKVTTGTETKIPISTLASDIYILKLDFDKGAVTKKVVVN